VHQQTGKRLRHLPLTDAERSLLSSIGDAPQSLEFLAQQSPQCSLERVYQLSYALTVLGLATVGGWTAGTGPKDSDLDREARVERGRIQAKWAQLADSDYFAILGIRPDASGYEVQQSFERACRDFSASEFHRAVASELGEALAEIRTQLEVAYRSIYDDGARESYRRALTSEEP
jgi:hypothetical protein